MVESVGISGTTSWTGDIELDSDVSLGASDGLLGVPIINAFGMTELHNIPSAALPGHDVRGKVFLPLSIKKPGALVSIAVKNGDEFQFQARYTGDGAGGHTAQVQVAMLGRRRYREC